MEASWCGSQLRIACAAGADLWIGETEVRVAGPEGEALVVTESADARSTRPLIS